MNRSSRLVPTLCVTPLAMAALPLLLLIASGAKAERVVLEPVRDVTLIESADGRLANGAGPALFVGRTSQARASLRRAAIAFDVAGHVPAGAWITRVELVLELTPSNSPVVEVGLHRALAGWSEGPSYASGGGGAPAEPGDATWLHRRFDDEFWSWAGGDFAPRPSGFAVVGGPGVYSWASTPGLVLDVQGWLDAPDSNHGWLLIGDEFEPTTAKRFVSREGPAETGRPRLVVDFETGCDEADLPRTAFGLCNAYCEALDCDGPRPRGSARACRRLAHDFARLTRGAALPCALPDRDGDGVVDDADSCPWTPNADQADLDADDLGDACARAGRGRPGT